MAEEEIDTMYEDAVDALRQGDRARGKDILTRLLKTDQNNATYWIWMSAAVDTAKERIYCLETALKLDPQNAIAKRGLVLLGGLPPDEDIQPFPLNHPRAWEDDLLLSHEKPQERGVRAILNSPVTRLAGVALGGLLVIGLAFYGFENLQRTPYFRPAATHRSGPTPRFTLTPTFVNATGAVIPTSSGPTPLAELLGIFYTPTPLYISTPRSPLTADTFRSAKAAYDQGNWDEYIRQMEKVREAEPTAADVPYYIGEAYRFKGDCRMALDFYNQSLRVDDKFAPGFVGLARARTCMDSGADTTQLYDLAIQADPNYGQAYLDRANFYLVRRNYKSALPDLQKAEKLMPDSALVQLGYAEAYLLGGDNVQGLAAARKANSIDQTIVTTYYFLGYAYSANGQYADAIKPLQLYILYQTNDGSAYALLGQAFTKTGAYESAKEPLRLAVKNDPNQVRSYIYLGTASLRTDDLTAAEENFKKGLQFFPDSFDANIGLTETMYRKGTFGNAYLQAETAKSKATTQSQVALAIYWRALSHEGRQDPVNAIKDWKALLAMPETAMTPEMRQTAEHHLADLAASAPTAKGGIPTASRTPPVTAKPSGSGTPTRTPTATPKP